MMPAGVDQVAITRLEDLSPSVRQCIKNLSAAYNQPRWKANQTKATWKAALQRVVADEVKAGTLELEDAIAVLSANNAYGREGRKALEGVK